MWELCDECAQAQTQSWNENEILVRDLRFAICDLRFAIYDLRFTIDGDRHRHGHGFTEYSDTDRQQTPEQEKTK
ncbi:hypothetical protein N7466_009735 [Penicillium verhagenii]|uniref:uncharacterized protein n=1 Tax=Penicillium verhagenii TaxID=1562060 RepID=UPI0025450E34|nr:uncharacterized protein N7466_009735 [Penicillium verhagenii]KAJ5921409.1 hypothetical protein N7466_009735 [Penicillium verhagenii]